MFWYLYIAKCRDESLYTGITTDIPRRIKEHNAKKGAFYTKNKLPVELVYQEIMANQSEARKREAAIKKLTRKDKLKLIYAPRRTPTPTYRGVGCAAIAAGSARHPRHK